jgi:hypothetical protein
MDIRSRESGFTPAECDHFINYMLDLQAGRNIPQSFNPWPYEDKPRLRVSFDGVSRFTPTH